MGTTIIKTFALAALASTALVGMTLPNAASAQDRYGQNNGYSHSQTYGQSGGQSGGQYGDRSTQGYHTASPAYDQRSYTSGHNGTYGRSNDRNSYGQDNRRYGRAEDGRNDWGRSERDRRETRWNYRHHHHHDWRSEDDRRGW